MQNHPKMGFRGISGIRSIWGVTRRPEYWQAVIATMVMALSASAGWWNTEPSTNGAYLTITRIATSEQRAQDTMPITDSGFDYPDTDSEITENYGGSPFVVGAPLQISVYIAAVTGGWDWVSLEWAYGTNATTADAWSMIGTLTAFESVTNVNGCHFGLQWVPPTTETNYLFRIVGKPTLGNMLSADTNAVNITAKGDEVTWMNHQVGGVYVTSNKRPGSR